MKMDQIWTRTKFERKKNFASSFTHHNYKRKDFTCSNGFLFFEMLVIGVFYLTYIQLRQNFTLQWEQCVMWCYALKAII